MARHAFQHLVLHEHASASVRCAHSTRVCRSTPTLGSVIGYVTNFDRVKFMSSDSIALASILVATAAMLGTFWQAIVAKRAVEAQKGMRVRFQLIARIPLPFAEAMFGAQKATRLHTDANWACQRRGHPPIICTVSRV